MDLSRIQDDISSYQLLEFLFSADWIYNKFLNLGEHTVQV